MTLLLNGDCVETLRTWFADNHFDSVVTDPPYELGFMGKAWDKSGVAFDPVTWREVLRVMKPGAHLLAFGGTRTYHRMVCAIEDAGFEIRDQIQWIYGSGFPKASNLKPAHEPICVARKPFKGSAEVNVVVFGVGKMFIEECRVTTSDNLNGGAYAKVGGRTESQSLHGGSGMNVPGKTVGTAFQQPIGRWPANVIHDGSDEVLAAFPDAPGQLADESLTAPSAKTGNTYGAMQRQGESSQNSENAGCVGFKMKPGARRLDSGSAARFFYCAKASKKDRGIDNTHPTVKPSELMRYLCRLVTPAGGKLLDPFMGSGSTGVGAIAEGFEFFGIDKDSSSVAIAERRLV